MAQAEMPADQNCCSEGMPRRLAVAPVAMITLCARTVVSVPRMVKGREEKSTDSTSSVLRVDPQRFACARMRSIRSGPVMPSGKPGKFSTSVVVISCPPRTPPVGRARA